MEVKKTNQRIGKKIRGKGLKCKKLQGLPLHWFFTSDSTIAKTSSITIKGIRISKSQ
jgi:hypothetical protein